MRIIKLIAFLLDYPQAELFSAEGELRQVIAEASQIPEQMKAQLSELLDELMESDLMDLQEQHDGLFDRGRAISLLLFEHVHGESRARGQAMVDLLDTYQKAGFNIQVRELPDYLPLYLEFLAHQDDDEARSGLADVAHILALLSARLRERGSRYSVLFDALLLLTDAEVDQQDIEKTVAGEERDDTLAALDKVWEEEMVMFMGDDPSGSCSTAAQARNRKPAPAISPVQWVDLDRTKAVKESNVPAFRA
jgi:nitrate reductase delta subunit